MSWPELFNYNLIKIIPEIAIQLQGYVLHTKPSGQPLGVGGSSVD